MSPGLKAWLDSRNAADVPRLSRIDFRIASR